MGCEPGFEGLGDASGLDTTPELYFESPFGLPQPVVSSYHVVVKWAAELLNLPLSTKGIRSNLLNEVLYQTPQSSKPLLPFHEALSEPVSGLGEAYVCSSGFKTNSQ